MIELIKAHTLGKIHVLQKILRNLTTVYSYHTTLCMHVHVHVVLITYQLYKQFLYKEFYSGTTKCGLPETRASGHSSKSHINIKLIETKH